MINLIGKTIKGIYIEKGEDSILFVCSDGTNIGYKTDGACCSRSWFSNFLGVAQVLDGTVIDFDAIVLTSYNTDDGRTRQEEDSVYGFKIVTERGTGTLIFRNSSNGYYDGWMNYGGWMNYDDRVTLTPTMKPIFDDWIAD